MRRREGVRHGPEGSTAGASGRILVVEDNLINQKVAVALLTQMGYACDVASDGSQALAFLRRRRYDLVLMDCQMPVMDGYRATEEIRRWEGNDRTPIVAMTAAAMASDREHCLAVGMDDYLAKPIDRPLLISALQRCLDLPRLSPDATLPAPAGPPQHGDPVDVEVLAQLRQLDGGGGLFEQLVEVFRREVAPRMPELRRAIDDHDLTRARDLAHGFKGACATLGLKTLTALLSRVEEGATGRVSEDLSTRVSDVEREFVRALDRLDTLAGADAAGPSASVARRGHFGGVTSG